MTTPSVTPAVVAVMARLTEAGVRVAPDGPNLRCWCDGPITTELRELVVEHKPALIAALSVWCSKRAAMLEDDAYALLERLGVSGSDPEITAVERYSAADFAHDMLGVRAACFDLERRARSLAAQRDAGGAIAEPGG